MRTQILEMCNNFNLTVVMACRNPKASYRKFYIFEHGTTNLLYDDGAQYALIWLELYGKNLKKQKFAELLKEPRYFELWHDVMTKAVPRGMYVLTRVTDAGFPALEFYKVVGDDSYHAHTAYSLEDAELYLLDIENKYEGVNNGQG